MKHLADYKKAEINAADSVRLITMLYDGAINFIKTARMKMRGDDMAGKGLYITKAIAIVSELSNYLDMNAGGETAKNLNDLYYYVLIKLLDANLRNDHDALNEAEKTLTVITDAWKEMERGRLLNDSKTAASKSNINAPAVTVNAHQGVAISA